MRAVLLASAFVALCLASWPASAVASTAVDPATPSQADGAGRFDGRSAEPVLNPPDHVEIAPGTLLYYLADARIDSARMPWAALAAA